MSTINVTNATPHPVRVLASVFNGKIPFDVHRGELATLFTYNNLELYEIQPSGFRLAAEPVVHFGPLGCRVEYRLAESAESEIEAILLAHSQHMGGGEMVCIASEISCRALMIETSRGSRLNDPSGGTPVRAMWPVLDPRSFGGPMSDRWAMALAVPHVVVKNDAGEDVGFAPIY